MELRARLIRRLLLGAVVLVMMGVALPGCASRGIALPEQEELPKQGEKVFCLSSPAFEEGGRISIKYTCQGMDVSPPLVWSKPPAGTQSFTLIVDDLNAPGGAFTHWVLFNIPSDNRELPEAVPTQAELPSSALQGKNDFGEIGYGGPCPPAGAGEIGYGKPCPPAGGLHKYQFTFYALDQPLDLGGGTSKNKVLDAMQGHILTQTKLTCTYQKVYCTI